jgi:hypothetical protein
MFNASIRKDGLCMTMPRKVVNPICIRSELADEEKLRDQPCDEVES